MAKVYSNVNDFVLFPRKQPYMDTLDPRLGDNFVNLNYQPNAVSNMLRLGEFSGLASTSYEPHTPLSAYSSAPSAYFAAQKVAYETQKGNMGQPMLRQTNSGSPSPSFSQAFDHPPSTLSSASGASGQSTASSADGSPYTSATHVLPYEDKWSGPLHGLGIAPGIVSSESISHESFPPANFENDLLLEDSKFPNYVDPSLIQQFDTPMSHNTTTAPYSGAIHAFPHLPSQTFQRPSPAASETSSQDSHRPGSARFRSGTTSPYLHTASHQPYPQGLDARRFSIASSHSRNSLDSPGSNGYGFDDDGKERTRCPHPDCGRPFKDLKAHMLTHQSERPEKCPITTCAYHQKGFARKYDKNRHTLTHYKGNMVCGFCPGSGSASEKSFNRADVFKRHLTSVHGVEQTPPNSRKKSPSTSTNKKVSTQAVDATGKCSTCSATFKNAQDFYEHLDDCVLRVVQQEEPSEAINEQHLGGVANDEAVRDTMDRHMISAETDFNLNATAFDEEEGDENDDDFKDESSEDNQAWAVRPNVRSGKGEIPARRSNSCWESAHPQGVGHTGGGNLITKSGRTSSSGKGRGMTASKGGVPLVGKGRRRRKHYPVSWGCAKDQMKMKKRVLCVYDGPRRLWKDDMMLDSDFEVRMRFGDGESYVTDLDVQTVKRAEALHNATDEEKGPWTQDGSETQQLVS